MFDVSQLAQAEQSLLSHSVVAHTRLPCGSMIPVAAGFVALAVLTQRVHDCWQLRYSRLSSPRNPCCRPRSGEGVAGQPLHGRGNLDLPCELHMLAIDLAIFPRVTSSCQRWPSRSRRVSAVLPFDHFPRITATLRPPRTQFVNAVARISDRPRRARHQQRCAGFVAGACRQTCWLYSWRSAGGALGVCQPVDVRPISDAMANHSLRTQVFFRTHRDHRPVGLIAGGAGFGA